MMPEKQGRVLCWETETAVALSFSQHLSEPKKVYILYYTDYFFLSPIYFAENSQMLFHNNAVHICIVDGISTGISISP